MLIEIKYVRSATEFKKVEKEIYEDSVAYLNEKTTYRKIIVFIYDASSSAQEHATTTDALLGVGGITDVVIASRPSQLPPPGRWGSTVIHGSCAALPDRNGMKGAGAPDNKDAR